MFLFKRKLSFFLSSLAIGGSSGLVGSLYHEKILDFLSPFLNSGNLNKKTNEDSNNKVDHQDENQFENKESKQINKKDPALDNDSRNIEDKSHESQDNKNDLKISIPLSPKSSVLSKEQILSPLPNTPKIPETNPKISDSENSSSTNSVLSEESKKISEDILNKAVALQITENVIKQALANFPSTTSTK